MRQGNDVGSQYRSTIFCKDQVQLDIAIKSKNKFEAILQQSNFSSITTEISIQEVSYPAEDYHQQYSSKTLTVIVASKVLGVPTYKKRRPQPPLMLSS